MDASRPYRSNLPCDNLDKYPSAKRIVEQFQKLMPFHSRGGAIEQIIGRLNDGEQEAALIAAATAYASWASKARVEGRYALSPARFYEMGGEWERFKDGTQPDVPRNIRDPGAARAAAMEAEMRANKARMRELPKRGERPPTLLGDIFRARLKAEGIDVEGKDAS